MLLDGAEDACRILSAVYDLYIVTNGVERTQKKRLANSAVKPYIKDIFVSEKVGVPKPMKEYFDYVFAHIGEERRESSVIIGDSLTSDIEGGRRAGIDTILFCPSGKLSGLRLRCRTISSATTRSLCGFSCRQSDHAGDCLLIEFPNKPFDIPVAAFACR